MLQKHNIEEPCAYLEDGYYAIRDVFTILFCHSHHHHYIPCPAGQVYVPGHKKCSPAKDIKLGKITFLQNFFC